MCGFFIYIYLKILIMIQVLQSILKTLIGLKSGGFTNVVKLTGVQIGVSGAAYASGDVLGDTSPIKTELVRGNYGTGVLQTIIVKDLSAQSGAIDFVFFDSNPSSTTFTDNSALDIADADMPKVLGVVSVTASEYKTFVDSNVAVLNNIGLVLKNADGSPNIWVCPVSRDAKTYVADELSVSFGMLQD